MVEKQQPIVMPGLRDVLRRSTCCNPSEPSDLKSLSTSSGDSNSGRRLSRGGSFSARRFNAELPPLQETSNNNLLSDTKDIPKVNNTVDRLIDKVTSMTSDELAESRIMYTIDTSGGKNAVLVPDVIVSPTQSTKKEMFTSPLYTPRTGVYSGTLTPSSSGDEVTMAKRQHIFDLLFPGDATPSIQNSQNTHKHVAVDNNNYSSVSALLNPPVNTLPQIEKPCFHPLQAVFGIKPKTAQAPSSNSFSVRGSASNGVLPNITNTAGNGMRVLSENINRLMRGSTPAAAPVEADYRSISTSGGRSRIIRRNSVQITDDKHGHGQPAIAHAIEQAKTTANNSHSYRSSLNAPRPSLFQPVPVTAANSTSGTNSANVSQRLTSAQERNRTAYSAASRASHDHTLDGMSMLPLIQTNATTNIPIISM
jgi:hypothetical protein